ncbi:MAG: PAS domain S-box protein [Chloroflexota bacterium]
MLPRIRRFFDAPLFESEEKSRAARFLNIFSWSAIAILLVYILLRIAFFPGARTVTLVIIGLIILILGLGLVIMRRGQVRLAGMLLISCSWVGMTYLAWTGDGVRDSAVVAYLMLIMLASLLLDWRAAFLTALISIGAIWYFAILESNGVHPIRVDEPLNDARDLTSIIVLCCALIYLLISNMNRSLQNTHLELEERLKAEEKLQRQADYLTALHETTLGVVNRLEIHPLLESILTRACELIGTPHGFVDLVLPDGSALCQELGRGALAQFNRELTQKNEGATGRTWATGETIFVKDYSTWEGRIQHVANVGFREVICVPLKSGPNIIGVLSVAHVETDKTFSPMQITLLERFAALASIAIDNARLYEQAQSELRERRATETALRASEERFRKIFHASPVAISITTLEEGCLLDANEAYWTLFALDPSQALGKTVVELDHYRSREEREAFLQKLLQMRSVYEPDYKFRTAAGDQKFVIAFFELVQLAEETTILSMFYDVSAQKQAQLALQASEERFRKVFQSSQMAICIATLEEGRFVVANDAFWNLTGMRPESAIGRTALELGLWKSDEQREAFVQELLSRRSLKNVDYEFPHSNGERRSTLAFYELITLEDETCVLAMFYDITVQKQAQEALRQSEARTRALLNAIPDMIFEISDKGVFINFIPSSELQPAVPPEEFLGKHIADVFPPHITAQSIFALDRALKSGQLQAFEYGMPPGEETYFFEARVTPVGAESAMVMVRNITQRKWVETEREKLIKELEGKNAELERFTYTVSHDLKSPLITIKGFLGFLEHDASTGNIVRLKSDIQRIADATDKMQTLLNELLQLSRVGHLMNPPQKFAFEEIAREAVELVQGRIQSGNIQIEIQQEMSAVYGDRQRLLEAVQNIVDNAAKFMGDQPNPRIVIGQLGYEGTFPIFFVKDNGIGIAPEHQDRVFGLFNKLDATSDGTGIGLALVKRIIEVHGGRIWVESEAGKGAAFCFTLPAGPQA